MVPAGADGVDTIRMIFNIYVIAAHIFVTVILKLFHVVYYKEIFLQIQRSIYTILAKLNKQVAGDVFPCSQALPPRQSPTREAISERAGSST